MLSLTRRIDETLMVYEGNRKIAEITIGEIRGRQVRLKLEAPREIAFVRAELIGREAEDFAPSDQENKDE